MKQEQQKQAERLYFQTDLTVAAIADQLGISRRTMQYWIAENHWDRIKQNSSVMPCYLVENCYQVMGRLTESILSPEREGKPVTPLEINGLNKLSVTISRITRRTSLNESMEMFARFTEVLAVDDPELAQQLEPHISKYISGRAAVRPAAQRPSAPALFPAHKTAAPSPIPPQPSCYTRMSLPPFSWPPFAHPFSDPAQFNRSARITGFRQSISAPSHATPAPNNKPAPKQQPPQTAPKQKFDIRKALRGTASKGPGKAWRKQQALLKAQAA